MGEMVWLKATLQRTDLDMTNLIGGMEVPLLSSLAERAR